MSLLDHLTANASTPPPAPPEPTLEDLELALAADPSNAELRAYVDARRPSPDPVEPSAPPEDASRPVRLSDLPPPIVVDLQPAAAAAAEPKSEYAKYVEQVPGGPGKPEDPTVPPPAPTRGRPKGSRNKPAEPVAPLAYDRAKAAREIIAIECIRRDLQVADAERWIAFVEGGAS